MEHGRKAGFPVFSVENPANFCAFSRTSPERGIQKSSIAGFERRGNQVRSDWVVFLQRLFSTFPNSWPGFGLLLFRLSLAVGLVWLGVAALSGEPSAQISLAMHVLSIAGAVFLAVGLWTPVAGALVALDQVSIAALLYPREPAQSWIHLFLAVLSISIAMLGPGAWSIDARLFGRKRFRIEPKG
jgi:putative oxidoreductase